MEDTAFQKAYERGLRGTPVDNRWQWRVHVGLWAAHTASKLEGDFIECGVNYGFLSAAIMQYLDWNTLPKTFILMDTFSGRDQRYVSQKELDQGKLSKKHNYTSSYESVKENFSEWQNVKFIKGAIPDTLQEARVKKVAYLHLDMNCAPPEVAAFNHFWELMVPGAMILLDDYAYSGFHEQKYAMDKAADEKGIKIVSLPTGQGLIVKS